MISAEAPILFAKAAELFIRELTLRAWIHTERNRRRTLQRNDIAMAVSDGDTDQFDFLIDIVPREEARGHRRPPANPSSVVTGSIVGHSPASLKQEVAHHATTFVTNGRNSLTMTQPSGQVVSTLNTDGVSAGVQPIQTVTIALGGAGTIATTGTNEGPSSNASGTNQTSAVATTSVGAVPGQTVVQATGAAPGSAIQFTTVPAPTGTVSASTGTTVVASTQSTTTATASTTPAPIQYVLQLPGGATAAGQPFQIQLLPQHFQTSSTDAISGSQTGTLLTDANGNTIPVVQVVSQAGGLTLPIVQDANGTRTQIIQLQNTKTGSQ
ncbi:Nuclear transcription factor Y subunit gamma [Fasciola gigantica]|uniref:Nuclear transcription factor Y subunit gamma n=1 Tax=Fasciola gigantica TaxID=46835 RepID=A0A504YGD4_FASGI|nr:Nuclear transcription factor Y subunit gamma [Fasciola gigantica]